MRHNLVVVVLATVLLAGCGQAPVPLDTGVDTAAALEAEKKKSEKVEGIRITWQSGNDVVVTAKLGGQPVDVRVSVINGIAEQSYRVTAVKVGGKSPTYAQKDVLAVAFRAEAERERLQESTVSPINERIYRTIATVLSRE